MVTYYCFCSHCSLDQDLYQDCKDDAKRLCSAPDFNEETLALPPGIVLSCLYRASMSDVPKDHKVFLLSFISHETVYDKI